MANLIHFQAILLWERRKEMRRGVMGEVLRGEKTGLQTQSRGVVGKRGAHVQLDQSIKIKKLAKM